MALTKVSTDGVKDDAITKTKIPANQIEASELADNAVDTNAIADDAVNFNKISHIDSGRLLGRVSGGLGQIETPNASQIRTLLNVADGANQTTINSNADNRLITGTGTANTLNAESNATFNGQKLSIGPLDGGTDVNLNIRNTNSGGYGAYISGGSSTNYILRLDDYQQNNMFRFNANGKLGIGTAAPIGQVHLYQSSNDPYLYIQRGSGDTSATIGGIFWRNSTNNLGLIDVQSGDIDAGRMRFYVNKNGSLTESLKIDEYGNLEVLDASEARLQVKTPSNGIIALRADGSNTQLGTWSNHDLKIVRNSTIKGSFTANGLCFNSDTAAANALDDYEEGTWTPQAAAGVSGYQFANSAGYYTKIGNIVWWFVHTTTSLVPNDNNVYEIHGLPYTSASTNHNYGWNANIVYTANSNNTIIANMRPLVQRAASYVYFHRVGEGTASRVTNSQFRTGMQGETMIMAGNYQAG